MRKEKNLNIQRMEESKKQGFKSRNRKEEWKIFCKFSLLLFLTWDENITVLEFWKAQQNLYPSPSLKNPY